MSEKNSYESLKSDIGQAIGCLVVLVLFAFYVISSALQAIAREIKAVLSDPGIQLFLLVTIPTFLLIYVVTHTEETKSFLIDVVGWIGGVLVVVLGFALLVGGIVLIFYLLRWLLRFFGWLANYTGFEGIGFLFYQA